MRKSFRPTDERYYYKSDIDYVGTYVWDYLKEFIDGNSPTSFDVPGYYSNHRFLIKKFNKCIRQSTTTTDRLHVSCETMKKGGINLITRKLITSKIPKENSSPLMVKE